MSDETRAELLRLAEQYGARPEASRLARSQQDAHERELIKLAELAAEAAGMPDDTEAELLRLAVEAGEQRSVLHDVAARAGIEVSGARRGSRAWREEQLAEMGVRTASSGMTRAGA